MENSEEHLKEGSSILEGAAGFIVEYNDCYDADQETEISDSIKISKNMVGTYNILQKCNLFTAALCGKIVGK